MRALQRSRSLQAERHYKRSGIASGAADRYVAAAMEMSATALKQCRYGRMLYLPHDRFVGRSLDLYGEYVEGEARLFAQLLQPGQVVVEVGANLGAHTVHLAKLVGPGGTVVAFEPQRAMFYLLCANLALNEQFHVQAYRAAVGNAVGAVRVPLLDYRGEANFGGVALSDAGAGETVPLTRLDAIELPSLRLLKIDVEGMEIEVLRGAQQTIARHRPVLYVENDRREQSRALIGMIEQAGYELYWDLPALFNPNNFFGHRENVFGRYISINLMCLPKELPFTVTNFRKVTGPDDWWEQRG